MLDWKVIVAVLAAFLVLSGGLLKDVSDGVHEKDIRKILNTLKDNLGKVINLSNFEVQAGRDINVSGKVSDMEELEFDNTRAGSAEIRYMPENMNATIDGNQLTSEKSIATITFTGYKGKAEISSGRIDISGNADSVNLEGYDLDSEEGIKLSLKGDYRNVSFDNMEIKNLEFSESSGDIKVDSTISISLRDKPVTIKEFLGNLTFSSGNLELEGRASKITSDSKEVSVSSVD